MANKKCVNFGCDNQAVPPSEACPECARRMLGITYNVRLREQAFCAYHSDKGWSSTIAMTTADSEDLAWEKLKDLMETGLELNGCSGWDKSMEQCSDLDTFKTLATALGWSVVICFVEV